MVKHTVVDAMVWICWCRERKKLQVRTYVSGKYFYNVSVLEVLNY